MSVPIFVVIACHGGFGYTARQAAAVAAGVAGVDSVAGAPTEPDLCTARYLGQRVAHTALRFVHGREAAASLMVTA